MSKVPLIREKERPWVKEAGVRPLPLTMALPFFRSATGVYFHRVRSGQIHYTREGKYSHTSIKYWCGNQGFLSHEGALLSSDPGPQAIHCAICEGKSAGMGLDGTTKILGRLVRYSPRL